MPYGIVSLDPDRITTTVRIDIPGDDPAHVREYICDLLISELSEIRHNSAPPRGRGRQNRISDEAGVYVSTNYLLTHDPRTSGYQRYKPLKEVILTVESDSSSYNPCG